MSEESPPPGKVRQLSEARARRQRREPPITHMYKTERPFCTHRRTQLDFAHRLVECRDCEAELDPYQVLRDLMQASDYTAAVRRKRELEDECASLEKERQRLRAAVNRLKRQ